MAPRGRNAATGEGHVPPTREMAGNPTRGSSQVSPLEDLMRRKGVDEAWDALEKMQKQGEFTDRFTISRMLMRTLSDGRRLWDPAKIHRSVALVDRFLQQQPEEADEVLFNALLDTHCRMKDIGGLESTFRLMRKLKIEPSHVTLGILVKAYGQACDIKSVLRLWDEMVEQRTQANAVTYGCMINACVRCGQTEKAVEIFNEMKSLGKHCNTILYTTLIKGYGNEKDLRSALALFHEMREENVPYNTIAYNSIIDVCIKCSDMQSAEDVFREMLSPSSTVQPDLITYSTLLKGYCQIGNLDKALQVAETIKACGLKCDELVYNTLMDGCVKANDLSAGVGLFSEMMQSGMKPSSITHSIFLRLYQRNGYKGNASDAVAQLYQHHGLERPRCLDKMAKTVGAGNHSIKHEGGRKDGKDNSRDGDRDSNSYSYNSGGGKGLHSSNNSSNINNNSNYSNARRSSGAGAPSSSAAGSATSLPIHSYSSLPASSSSCLPMGPGGETPPSYHQSLGIPTPNSSMHSVPTAHHMYPPQDVSPVPHPHWCHPMGPGYPGMDPYRGPSGPGMGYPTGPLPSHPSDPRLSPPILSRPSTYGGYSMERGMPPAPGPYPPYQSHQLPPHAHHGPAMETSPHSPYHQQAMRMVPPGPYGGMPPPNHQDPRMHQHYPSLLIQQRPAEDYMDAAGAEYWAGGPAGAPLGRKPPYPLEGCY